MKRAKLTVTVSLLLLSFIVPALSIPRANAFHSSNSFTISGLAVQSYFDSFLDTTVDAAREGSTLNFNVLIVASSLVLASGLDQRNITVGVKVDWLTSYTNASNAKPTQTLPLKANQNAIVTVAIPIPQVSGFYSNINTAIHTWTGRVWSSKANTTATDCSHSGGSLSGCFTFGSGALAVYSNTQADGVLAKKEAEQKLSTLQSEISGVLQPLAGASKAASEVAQGNAEITLGNIAYARGDFASAKTDYTNALNLANSAASDLSSAGGGVDSASFWQPILNGVGVLLVGVGVVVGAFSAMMYLNKRGKQKTVA